LHNGDGVSGEQRATLDTASGPVQHRGAVEVSADAGQGEAVADVMYRENLLTAVRDVRADAVMYQLTALGTRVNAVAAPPLLDQLGRRPGPED
jgi:hypothetical protein